MKHKNILCAIACLLTAGSCDVVDNYTAPTAPPPTEGRTVLLEEYTGMLCVNCPAASQEAQLLKETFGSKLILVAVHAGDFAKPNINMRTDLRSDAGEAYWKAFGFNSNPIGMVDRTARDGSPKLNPSNWAAAIREQMAAKASAEVALEVSYNDSDRSYTCRVVVSGLQESAMALTLWLVEDGVVAPQVVPGGVDQNYVQRHVLRRALNNTWGEPMAPDDTQTWHAEQSYTLPEKYRPENCSVVAFVATSSRKIVCATETPLI